MRLAKKYKPHYKMVFMTPRESVMKEMKKLYPKLDYTFDIEPPLEAIVVLNEDDFGCIKDAKRMENTFASVGISVATQIAPWGTFKRIIKHDASIKGDVNLIAWTINEKSRLKCLINLGVDGIVTDVPDVLAKLVRHMMPTTASGY